MKYFFPRRKKMKGIRRLPKASRSSSRRLDRERKLLTKKRRRMLRKTMRKSLRKKKLWRRRRNLNKSRRLRMPKRRSISFSLSLMAKGQSGKTLR
jgi:hypothetical protein